MGKHKDWRKIAKNERRRRFRVREAKAREEPSEEYLKWLEEQEILVKLEYEQIEKSNLYENKKWLEAEKNTIEQWNILQERKRCQLQEYLQQEAKLKLEWELEQKRKKEAEERLQEMEEEKRKQQQNFMSKLEQFLSGDLTDPPPELLISHETRPQTELCPFFLKTACCRFGDMCSRNHRYPGISKVLLAPNFYVHFGLNNANFNEYDTDVMLEYEDSDTQREFVEFFDDVLPEFEKFGRITQFKVSLNTRVGRLIIITSNAEYNVDPSDKIKPPISIYLRNRALEALLTQHGWASIHYLRSATPICESDLKRIFNHVVSIQTAVCNNYEKHLRGNTYVEYAEVRCAVAAYQSLHSRWYGGRQLSLQFCLIDSWKNAICGLASRRRCPKGRACNFLHVFRNPRGFYDDYRFEHKRNTVTRPHSWRWSESPEKEIRCSKERANSNERNQRSKESSLKLKSRRTNTNPKRRRLRSPERTKSRRR